MRDFHHARLLSLLTTFSWPCFRQFWVGLGFVRLPYPSHLAHLDRNLQIGDYCLTTLERRGNPEGLVYRNTDEIRRPQFRKTREITSAELLPVGRRGREFLFNG